MRYYRWCMDTSARTPDAVSGAELSEKYIRTFAGDMETLKKGGMPDLAPLADSSPESEKSMPLKTYADDFSQRMKEKHAVLATVLAAEQDAASGAPHGALEKTPRGNILYVVAGVVLLIAGITGAYIAYTRYLINLSPLILAPTVSAPIFVDEREEISGTQPAAILQAIEQSVTRTLAPGTVRLLYIASLSAAPDSVFSSLHLSAPDILLRNINADGSMVGIVSAGGTAASGGNVHSVQSPFFILSVVSYSDTFGGMLSWEPLMPRNLGQLFPSYPPPPVSTATATTTRPTTATTSAASTQPNFHDEVVSNHDVRVYRDEAGRSVLLYGYWNRTTLVIARDTAAFTEILQRLATSRAGQ